jgi:hypothetical protein
MRDTGPERSHTSRLLSEQVSQALLIAIGFVDRILATSLLFRLWDLRTFETWAACLALAGFVSLFEFGFNLYFNNRITIETEQGRHEDMRRTYFAANGIFALCGLTSAIGMSGAALVTQGFSEASLASILLCLAGSAKLAMSGTNALYRANRAYDRFALIQLSSEAGRIGLTIFAVLAGGSLALAAGLSSLAVVLVSVIFLAIDSRRRFYPHSLKIVWLDKGIAREAFGTSSAYFAQLVPVILWTSLPVLVLTDHLVGTATAGVIASFVLIRTLSNLARTPLQIFGIVFGQECGRRLALAEYDGALETLQSAARLFATLSGCATGLLVAGGAQIIAIWTGDARVFQPEIMAAAMAPMALAASSVLAHNVLVASNAPFHAAAGRWLQVLITCAWYLLGPGDNAAVRMMVALSLGELFGYAPLAYLAIARLIPGAGVTFQLRIAIITLFCALAMGGLVRLCLSVFVGWPQGGVIALGVAMAVAASAVPFVGLGRRDRDRVWHHAILPVWSRIRRKGQVTG